MTGMTGRNPFSLFGVLVVVVLLAACQKEVFECKDEIGCVHIKPDEPVKFGVLQALTGEVAPLGIGQVRGIKLAMKDRSGRFMDHQIDLQIEDTHCTAEGGANAALRVIADPQTVAIMGTTCSIEAASASKIMSEAGFTMISGNNSAPFLTSVAGKRAPDWHPGYFRTAPNEEQSGGAGATFTFERLGVRKAALLNDGDIYSRGLTDGFKQVFEKLGGEIVLDGTINKGDTHMGPVLSAVRASHAQLLFFPLFQPEGNHIVLQAKKFSGLENVVLMGDGALIATPFIEAVKEDGVGMYFVGPDIPRGPSTERLAAQYQAEYEHPPDNPYYLSAYDSAEILLEAVEKAAVREPDGTLHIGRKALRDAMYATSSFDGVTGRLACGELGDCAAPRFNVLRLDDPSKGLEGLKSNVVFTFEP